MIGMEWIRSGTFCGAMRMRDSTKNRRSLTLSWTGIQSHFGQLLPSGETQISADTDYRRAAAREIGAIALKILPVEQNLQPTVSLVDLNPRDETRWRGGGLSHEELALLFESEVTYHATKRMVSASVPTVGGIFLVRAMSDGYVEAIPFGYSDDGTEELQINKNPLIAHFMEFVPARGFCDPWTNTVILDMARENPYLKAKALGSDAGKYLSDLLFSSVNDFLGGALEPEAGDRRQSTLPPPGAIPMALAVAAQILGRDLDIHWQPAINENGYPRLHSINDPEATTRDEDLITALFNLATDTWQSELVVPDAYSEPGNPWRPKTAPAYYYKTELDSCHTALSDHLSISKLWKERSLDRDHSWRWHRPDGKPIRRDVLAKIDAHFRGA